MVRLKHNTVFSEQRKLDRVNTRAWQESLTHSTFKLHLPQCSKCVMFPVKPLLLLFRWGGWIPMQLLPAVLTCPVLSCPVLSCPVLSCPSCPWLPWPIWDSHTETCHADVLLKDRGRCLPQPVSLCVPLSPLLNPALALLTLFSSPPPPRLSLSRGTRRGSPPVHPP